MAVPCLLLKKVFTMYSENLRKIRNKGSNPKVVLVKIRVKRIRVNQGVSVPWFWIPACIFRIVSTLHPQQSWGPAGLNFMQPCNFTHWSTRSSHCSCTCDWHPLNGSLLYTPLTPFCCSKTPQKNSPLYTVRNKNSNVFAEFDSEKLNAVYYLWPDNFEENCQKANRSPDS